MTDYFVTKFRANLDKIQDAYKEACTKYNEAKSDPNTLPIVYEKLFMDIVTCGCDSQAPVPGAELVRFQKNIISIYGDLAPQARLYKSGLEPEDYYGLIASIYEDFAFRMKVTSTLSGIIDEHWDEYKFDEDGPSFTVVTDEVFSAPWRRGESAPYIELMPDGSFYEAHGFKHIDPEVVYNEALQANLGTDNSLRTACIFAEGLFEDILKMGSDKELRDYYTDEIVRFMRGEDEKSDENLHK